MGFDKHFIFLAVLSVCFATISTVQLPDLGSVGGTLGGLGGFGGQGGLRRIGDTATGAVRAVVNVADGTTRGLSGAATGLAGSLGGSSPFVDANNQPQNRLLRNGIRPAFGNLGVLQGVSQTAPGIVDDAAAFADAATGYALGIGDIIPDLDAKGPYPGTPFVDAFNSGDDDQPQSGNDGPYDIDQILTDYFARELEAAGLGVL